MGVSSGQGVIARLDRATQYSRVFVMNREAAAYWIPAFAGMTPTMERRGAFSRPPLQPRKPRLHRIVAAVEFAQVGQPAHRQPMHILFAGLEQGRDVIGHLGARLRAGGGG